MVIDVWPGIFSRKNLGLPGWKDVDIEYLHRIDREGNTAITRITAFNLNFGFNLDFCLILLLVIFEQLVKMEEKKNLAHFTVLRTF
jgi:hypothetical protein